MMLNMMIIRTGLQLSLCFAMVVFSFSCERKYISTSSKCTDGTRPVYYIRKGHGAGTHSWHVHFQGGGWCSDIESCLERMQSPYGGSEYDRLNVTDPSSCDDPKGYLFENTKYLTSNARQNHMMHNWNTVFVAYCDGGSFAGDATVEHKGRQLHFRGLDIRRGLIDTLLMTEGMELAVEVLISGCSAGALGVYLGLDAMAATIQSHRQRAYPTLGPVTVRGMADSGFFLNFHRPLLRNISGSSSNVRGGVSNMAADLPSVRTNRWYFATPGEREYEEAFRATFTLMNLTAGVNSRCLAYMRTVGHPDYLCMFPEYAVAFLTTPIFSKQTQFDAWQNANILRSTIPSAVNAYGKLLSEIMISSLIHRNNPKIDYTVVERVQRKYSDSMTQMLRPRVPPHALFVDSCVSHCSNCLLGPSDRNESIWTSDVLVVDRAPHAVGVLNVYDAFAEWYLHTLVIIQQQEGVGGREVWRSHGQQHQHKQHYLYQHTPERRLYRQDSLFPCSNCCLCAKG